MKFTAFPALCRDGKLCRRIDCHFGHPGGRYINIECENIQLPGGCPFGSSCRYDQSRGGRAGAGNRICSRAGTIADIPIITQHLHPADQKRYSEFRARVDGILPVRDKDATSAQRICAATDGLTTKNTVATSALYRPPPKHQGVARSPKSATSITFGDELTNELRAVMQKLYPASGTLSEVFTELLPGKVFKSELLEKLEKYKRQLKAADYAEELKRHDGQTHWVLKKNAYKLVISTLERDNSGNFRTDIWGEHFSADDFRIGFLKVGMIVSLKDARACQRNDIKMVTRAAHAANPPIPNRNVVNPDNDDDDDPTLFAILQNSADPLHVANNKWQGPPTTPHNACLRVGPGPPATLHNACLRAGPGGQRAGLITRVGAKETKIFVNGREETIRQNTTVVISRDGFAPTEVQAKDVCVHNAITDREVTAARLLFELCVQISYKAESRVETVKNHLKRDKRLKSLLIVGDDNDPLKPLTESVLKFQQLSLEERLGKMGLSSGQGGCHAPTGYNGGPAGTTGGGQSGGGSGGGRGRGLGRGKPTFGDFLGDQFANLAIKR